MRRVFILIFFLLIPALALIFSLVNDVIELVHNFNYKSFIKFMQLVESQPE